MEIKAKTAVKLFRKHWEKLAKTGSTDKSKHGFKDIYNDCFLCEYVMQQIRSVCKTNDVVLTKKDCLQCPIEWPSYAEKNFIEESEIVIPTCMHHLVLKKVSNPSIDKSGTLTLLRLQFLGAYDQWKEAPTIDGLYGLYSRWENAPTVGARMHFARQISKLPVKSKLKHTKIL